MTLKEYIKYIESRIEVFKGSTINEHIIEVKVLEKVLADLKSINE